jgi:sialate O-acetylesterase
MKYLLTIFYSFVFVFSNAKVVLPDLFSDYMVLQQNSYVKIWGIAKPNKCIKIKASWSEKELRYCTKKDGTWIISIKTPEAGFNEHTISFTESKTTTTINHVLIGEVWFCSGQSNMEMTFKGFNNQPIENAEKIISEADPNSGIRMLRVKRIGQEAPSKTAEGKWMNSTVQNVPGFSAVAYFFGLKLRQELNVPIGLINSSWGGSSVEGWMNRDLLNNYSDLDLKQEIPDNENWRKPCIMYNGMLKPFTDYIIRGFIWYQGESNIERYETYASKLKDMVTLWRYEWDLANLPFYLVEIAPCVYDHPLHSAKLREAQFKATEIIANSGIVSTNDLVGPEESKVVHPRQKQPIGERLANLALKKTYNKDTICAEFASFESMKTEKEKVVLSFKNTCGGLHNVHLNAEKNDSIIGFEMAGNDHIFYPASVTFIPNGTSNPVQIEVKCPQVINPESIRYAFKTYAVGNIRNNCNLPMIPFRTDNWEE